MDTEPRNEQVYTNRELWMLIERNNELNLAQHQTILETLDQLLAQAKKTNGNVMDLLLWRAYVKGAVWIVPLIVGGGVSLIVALTVSLIK